MSSARLPKKDMGVLESAQQRVAKMVKKLEQPFYEERLREVGMNVQPGKEKAQGIFLKSLSI